MVAKTIFLALILVGSLWYLVTATSYDAPAPRNGSSVDRINSLSQ